MWRILLDHFSYGWHQHPRALFRYQLRVIDLAGGIVENRDQTVIAAVLKPGMLTDIPCAAAFPVAAVAGGAAGWVPRRLALFHQTGSLQRQLHPGVAELDAVLPPATSGFLTSLSKSLPALSSCAPFPRMQSVPRVLPPFQHFIRSPSGHFMC